MSYSLPILNKKIIYLDQFAISNMMKALNPHMRSNKEGKVDEFWLRLFERLDSLSKLQLIICPDSEIHNSESLLSGFYEPLKRMYELMSSGRTFFEKGIIQRRQIIEHFTNWLNGRADTSLNLDPQCVIHGKINAWSSRLILSVNMGDDDEVSEEIKTFREQSFVGLEEVFNYWVTSKNLDLIFWYKNEITSFGKVTMDKYIDYLSKLVRVHEFIDRLEEILPNDSVDIITSLLSILENHGVNKAGEMWEKITEYFREADFSQLPTLHISALLFAAIARQAAIGRKKPPNRGTMNDITMISTYMPYCDAMFIDKEFSNILLEIPEGHLNYKTKIFSINSKENFMEYLNNIEKSAAPNHIAKVNEVYGESWRNPYLTLYQKE
ncbi:hypothetical protein BSK66_29365 [Paenibacillus odorifer]|uniref:Uncharacterized protein n=1 Tax=Paenibacillus odorifer TaxID=189426 RepID=A0A1R0X3D0_9BACL|nr:MULTISPECIES: hypothetical protein [Paenibacillus]ETT67434.1 hypothetical protein C171_03525 [Paenibacillus sp. FSL H8-237]OMD27894.1 hypothetical protein BJP51_01935 [Paenibacillus odorifer]OME47977.1 hypothetical protein BSK66_29365 [Paenibacillus odorifer]